MSRIKILVGGDAIVSKLSGTLDGQTAIAALEHALGALPNKPLLFDLRQIRCMLETRDVLDLAAFLTRHARGRSVKIGVLTPDPRPTVKGDLFVDDASAAGHQVRLFEDVAALCAWLGADVSRALSRVSE